MALPKIPRSEAIAPEEGAMNMQAAVYIGQTYLSIQHMDKVITTIAVLTKQIQISSAKMVALMTDSSALIIKPLETIAQHLNDIRSIMLGQFKLNQEQASLAKDQAVDQAHAAERITPSVERAESPLVEEENALLKFLRGAISALALLLALVFASLRNEFIDMIGRFQNAFKMIKAIPEALWLAARGLVDTLLSSLTKLGSRIAKLFSVESIYVRILDNLPKGIAAKLAGPLGKMLESVSKIGSVLSKVGFAFKTAGQALGKIAAFFTGPIVKMMGNILEKAMKFLGPLGVIVMIFDMIEGFFTGLSEDGNLYTAIREGFLNVVKGFIELPFQLASLLMKAMGFDTAAASIEKAGGEATNTILGALRSIMDMITLVFVKITNAFKAVLRTILDFASKATSYIPGMGSISKSFKEAAESDVLASIDEEKVKEAQAAGGKAGSEMGLTEVELTAKKKKEDTKTPILEKPSKAPTPTLATTMAPTTPIKPDTTTLSKGSAAQSSQSPTVVVVPSPSGGGKGSMTQNTQINHNTTGGSTAPLSTRSYESAAYRMHMSWQFNNQF